MSRIPLIFLDRDNTINVDPGYIHSPDQVVLLPHAGEALRMLTDAGYKLIVISNQSGVGRGYFSEHAVHAVNKRINVLLVPYGTRITAFYMCFHHPDEICTCRKPGTGLLDQVREDFLFTPQSCFMIGDKPSDIDFGINAGIPSIKLTHHDGKTHNGAVLNTENLYQAAEFIVSQR